MKIVETASTDVKRVLQRSNPFRAKTWGKDEYLVWRRGGQGSCETPGITYEINCIDPVDIRMLEKLLEARTREGKCI